MRVSGREEGFEDCGLGILDGWNGVKDTALTHVKNGWVWVCWNFHTTGQIPCCEVFRAFFS